VPDFRLIELRELEYWTIPSEYRAALTDIITRYVCDCGTKVDGAYRLDRVGTYGVFADGTDAGLRGEIAEWLIADTANSDEVIYLPAATLAVKTFCIHLRALTVPPHVSNSIGYLLDECRKELARETGEFGFLRLQHTTPC
jgi:hypothetical protein